jgi:hypothetical protein
MLSGPPWQRAMPIEPPSPQAPLSTAEIMSLLDDAASLMGSR